MRLGLIERDSVNLLFVQLCGEEDVEQIEAPEGVEELLGEIVSDVWYRALACWLEQVHHKLVRHFKRIVQAWQNLVVVRL
jgi:hypothetical protein